MRKHCFLNVSLSSKQILLAVLLVSTCFQRLALFPVGEASIKPYHAVTLVLCLMSIAMEKSTWTLPGKPFFLAGLFVMGVSLFSAIRFGINAVLFNYAFFFILIVTVINFGRRLTLGEWGAVVRLSAFLVLAAIAVKDAIYIQSILGFVSHGGSGHPTIPTFFGGGVNLEASWIALFGVFFKRDKAGALYLTSSLLISASYASRTGLILSLLSIVYVLLAKGGSKRGGFFNVLKLALLLLGLVLIAQAAGIPIVERFTAVGEDKGSIGRENMWQYALPAFLDSPILGHGAGNTIPHISEISGKLFAEDNIHNYFLQVLLDFGLIGFLALAAMVVSVILNFRRGNYTNPFAAYILCWVAGSLFQFRGADALLAFFIAGYILTATKSLSTDAIAFKPCLPGCKTRHAYHGFESAKCYRRRHGAPRSCVWVNKQKDGCS